MILKRKIQKQAAQNERQSKLALQQLSKETKTLKSQLSRRIVEIHKTISIRHI